MPSSLSIDEPEVAFISGVAANGTVAPQSFWTWDGDQNATYGSNNEAKWGPALAGQGATITYAFAAASGFTGAEQGAFAATMALWSAVANVTFQNVGPSGGAEVTISRDSTGVAEGGITSLYQGVVGGAQLGHAVSGSIEIDTSVAGFGPLGASLSDYGGYPWMT